MDKRNQFLEKVISYIEKEQLIKAGDKIVVGVSGGADSVALLLALYSVKKELELSEDGLVAVHVNHMIRGDEALSDQRFVEQICRERSITCRVFSKDIIAYAAELGLTVEEAGRKYRYDCFNKVLEEYDFNKIAVAHNKNDLVETVLFNMARGSGLKGISGIPSKRDNIIRPLLFAERNEIEAYLSDIKQAFRTDSTNLSTNYDRNKIRHIVIPTLLEINAGAVTHIAKLAEEAQLSYERMRAHALKTFDLNIDYCKGKKETALSVDKLAGFDKTDAYYVLHEAISLVAGARKDITRRHIEAVYKLICQETGKRVELPYGVSARRSYDELIISKGMEENKDFNISIDGDGEYNILDNGILKVRICEQQTLSDLGKNNYTKVFDYDKIKGKLCVRTPRDGDYIIINKEGGSKKLSRVFIDGKLSRDKRKSWPVVAAGSEILWAVGLRYNEAYRVDAATKRVIYMEYIGKGETNG